MKKIFISYSHNDKEWVSNWLLTRLEDAGHRCCIDYRDFKIGRPSLLNMEEAVETCDKILLVLTPHWMESQWTNFEALMIQTKDPMGLKARVLPLILTKCKLPGRLAIFTYADFTDKNNWDSELERLLVQLEDTVPHERKIYLSKLPITRPGLFGRERVLEILDDAWKQKHTHVVTLTAWNPCSTRPQRGRLRRTAWKGC